MDKRKIENLRVKVSITEALFSLLEEKSISAISVSEIIERAHVARASFYRNYASKESVIPTMMTDMLESFRQTVVYENGNYYVYENIYRSFAFFKLYQKQVLDLHRFGYGSIVLDTLNRFHAEITGTLPDASIEKYQRYIYIGALYNTAMRWLQSDAQESIEQISEMFYRVCVEQMQPQMGEL